MKSISNVINPIQRKRVSIEVAQQIKSLIMNKNLKTGDRLPTERDLALMFSVSRPAIREALRSLEIMGFLHIHQGRGAFIRQFDYESYIESLTDNIHMMLFSETVSIDELWSARKLIEPHICVLASECANEDQLKEMEQILKNTRNSNFPRAAAMFHREVTKMTGNKVLIFLIDGLLTLRKMTRHKIMLGKEYQEDTLHFHQEIFEAIRAKDGEKARQLMYDHLEQVHRFYKAFSL